jgi:hypothetical protein
VAPFLLTAAVQAVYLVLYKQYFGGIGTEAA